MDIVIYNKEDGEVLVIITADNQVVGHNKYGCELVPNSRRYLKEDPETGKIKYIPEEDNIIYLDDYRKKKGDI